MRTRSGTDWNLILEKLKRAAQLSIKRPLLTFLVGGVGFRFDQSSILRRKLEMLVFRIIHDGQEISSGPPGCEPSSLDGVCRILLAIGLDWQVQPETCQGHVLATTRIGGYYDPAQDEDLYGYYRAEDQGEQ